MFELTSNRNSVSTKIEFGTYEGVTDLFQNQIIVLKTKWLFTHTRVYTGTTQSTGRRLAVDAQFEWIRVETRNDWLPL